jgi:hypothetical protein
MCFELVPTDHEVTEEVSAAELDVRKEGLHGVVPHFRNLLVTESAPLQFGATEATDQVTGTAEVNWGQGNFKTDGALECLQGSQHKIRFCGDDASEIFPRSIVLKAEDVCQGRGSVCSYVSRARRLAIGAPPAAMLLFLSSEERSQGSYLLVKQLPTVKL